MKKIILAVLVAASAFCLTACLDDEKAALKCEFGNCEELENRVSEDVCNDMPSDPYFSKEDCLKAAKQGAHMGTKFF